MIETLPAYVEPVIYLYFGLVAAVGLFLYSRVLHAARGRGE